MIRRLFIALLLLLGAMVATGCGIYIDRPVADLVPLYTNTASRMVEVDGIQVHYRDEGAGPVLLLLHGSNSSLHTWEGWADALKPDYRIISVDLPGHGLTGPHPDKAYNWSDAAGFLDRFVAKLKLQRVSIAGNSMGGGIAWHYALRYPEKMEKLILISSRGIPPEESMPFIFQAYRVPGLNQFLTLFTPRWLTAASVKDAYGDESKVTDAVVARYFDLSLREGNRSATVHRMTNLDTYEELPQLATLRIPVLIMWGEKDTWILPKYAERFAQILPHAEKILYPKLGHMPMEEAPEKTARDARDFLKQ